MIGPRRRFHRLRSVAVEAVLAAFGALLIASGMAKVESTGEFALLIEAHGVLPTGAGAVVAQIFPAAEVLGGLACVAGLVRRAWQGALFAVLVGMFTVLAFYLVAVAIAGHPKAECGCFGRFKGMSVANAIVRNVGCIAVAGIAIALRPSARPTTP